MGGNGASHQRFWLILALVATVLGGAVLALFITLGPAPEHVINWGSAFLLVGYMFAAMAVAGVVGFIFGIPRARAVAPAVNGEVAPPDKWASLRFEPNSNLEQISDWLTKILVGAGLVQLAAVPGFLRELGVYLGGGLGDVGPAASVALVLYGVGVGFLLAYLWARLRLRVLLETSEVDAQYESVRDTVERGLSQANRQSSKDAKRDNRRDIRRTAEFADQVADSIVAFKAVLWVDDHPSNNLELMSTMREMGIEVRIATSTEQALPMVTEDIGLVITDLGRFEDGAEVPFAGQELIERLAGTANRPYIIVYASRRGVQNRDRLLAAGADFVASSPSECLYQALRALVGEERASRWRVP